MSGVAFITGASSGLGAGFARRLAAEGWSVGLAARRTERLTELAEEIRAGGGAAAVSTCDVAEREQVHAAIDRTEAELGPVSMLIGNAGNSIMTEPDRLVAADVVQLMRVNFFGVVHAVERLLPDMLDRGEGHLIAVGSLAGYGGLPLTSAYSASKGALHNFMESLRVDLRGTGVDVTMLTPGYVNTDLALKALHRRPFEVELDDAVDRMMGAIRARRRLYAFPRPLSTLAWIGQVFPPGLYDWLASKQGRRKRR